MSLVPALALLPRLLLLLRRNAASPHESLSLPLPITPPSGSPTATVSGSLALAAESTVSRTPLLPLRSAWRILSFLDIFYHLAFPELGVFLLSEVLTFFCLSSSTRVLFFTDLAEFLVGHCCTSRFPLPHFKRNLAPLLFRASGVRKECRFHTEVPDLHISSFCINIIIGFSFSSLLQ